MRRLIQIKDGEPETQEIWLAFLRKHAYYGIGMKANVWEWAKLSMFIFSFSHNSKETNVMQMWGRKWMLRWNR